MIVDNTISIQDLVILSTHFSNIGYICSYKHLLLVKFEEKYFGINNAQNTIFFFLNFGSGPDPGKAERVRSTSCAFQSLSLYYINKTIILEIRN
jgi:hypothetical protein